MSAVVLHSVPTDVQLQTYAAPTCRDARDVWGSELPWYWTASRLLGGGSPVPPVCGTAPLTLVNLSSADLVAF